MRLLTILSIFLLTACSALPSSFNDENVLNLRQGTPSEEILEKFGKPKHVEVTTCGSGTDNPWTCTIWQYGDFPCGNASFYFATVDQVNGQLLLNHYDINRDVCY